MLLLLLLLHGRACSCTRWPNFRMCSSSDTTAVQASEGAACLHGMYRGMYRAASAMQNMWLCLQAGEVGHEGSPWGCPGPEQPCGGVRERQGLLPWDQFHLHGHHRCAARLCCTAHHKVWSFMTMLPWAVAASCWQQQQHRPVSMLALLAILLPHAV